jgi:hypothetical protein
MRILVRGAWALGAALAVTACSDPLRVDNTQDPDVDRVFSLPATIEQTIGSGYQQCRNSLMQNSLFPQLVVMAGESYSQLNNFNMGPRSALPRGPVLNARTAPSVFTEFSSLSRQSRVASEAVTALDRLIENEGTLGDAGRNRRARAFGFFVVGCNLGWLAMTYDSAAVVAVPGPQVVTPEEEAEGNFIPLSDHKTVMNAALALMDTAIAIASGPGGMTATDEAWLSGTSLNAAEFVRFVRSYKARFRAGVARTPEERDAANWTEIIADAENGIQTDILVDIGGSTGWNIGFQSSQMHVAATWSQLSPMYYGMADISGGYDAWLATPINERVPFLIVTPDKRWPQGTTRAAQRTSSVQPGDYLSRPYVSNRTGDDSPGDPWGTSNYDFFRFKYIRNASNQGTYPEFMKVELDLLAAEGYIRTGDIAKAAAKIDLSRTSRGELPALTGVITSATQPVPPTTPGGNDCVPRVPVGPTFTSTACGNIMEAMKWEKRMEIAFATFGAWFFDNRGWGDLIENTPLEYPVPFQEMDARRTLFYNLGGGGPSSAAKGTYGF